MPKSSSSALTTGSILAIIGLIVPQIFFLYTGDNNVSLFTALAYVYSLGYINYDWGFFSDTQWGLHLFDINWYLSPQDIGAGSDAIDAIIFSFESFLYGGGFGSSEVALSGMVFGLSLVLVIVGIILAVVLKNVKVAGILYVIAGILSVVALLLNWDNISQINILGETISDNFLPIPVGSILLLIGGYLNLKK